MLPRDELLESIDILVQNAKKETTQIYVGLVTAIANSGNTCTVKTNGKSYSGIIYYGDEPTVNKQYRVFAPNGSMNQAFIITGGSSGLITLPIASATQLGGIKVGAGLTINNSGVLSATGGGTADSVDWANVQDKPTTIAGYGIVDAKISGNNIILGSNTMTPYSANNAPPYPVTSVNGQTGAVTIDVGGNVDSVNGKTGEVVLDANDVGALPDTTVIPTKNSQLTNDSGYITSSALAPYAKSADIPTKVSDLTNDSGYITDSALEPYAKTADIPTKTSQLTNDSGYVDATGAKNAAPIQSVDGAIGEVVTNAVKTIAQALTDAQKSQARTNIGAGTSSFDGDYNNLSNKPTIPTKVSQLENDSNYATESQVDAKYTKPTSGIPKSDLTSDVQASLDKANTALQSAPVTSVNSKTGDVVLSADDVGALPDTTIIPNKTSDLTNDSGFITEVPIASKTQLGGVKVGAGLTVSSEGTISATGGGTADAVEWDNVLDKPTTIVGYGITDAKIDGGTITLGNQSITPLTQAPVSSVNGKTGVVNLTSADVGALPDTTKIPTKTSDITNDSGFITSADVPTKTSELTNDSGFIKASESPVQSVNGKTGTVTLTKSDVGLENVDNVKQYSTSNPPPYPVISVNGETGDVIIDDNLYLATLSGSGTDTDPYVIDKTFAEIHEAGINKKLVFLYQTEKNCYYPLVANSSGTLMIFAVMQSTILQIIRYSSNNRVSVITSMLEQTSNKVTEITSSSTNTQYPSAKAVWDLVSSSSGGTKVTQYTGTLLASGWAADSYGYQSQTITIAGLQASYDVDPEWDVALSGTDPDADAALLEGFALIHNYVTGANSLTAQCIGSAPTVNIPVKVVVFG